MAFRNGEFITCMNQPQVYYIWNNQRRRVSAAVMATLGNPPTRSVECPRNLTPPLGSDLQAWQNGTVVSSCDGILFQIENGQRIPLPANANLQAYPDVNIDRAICSFVETLPISAVPETSIVPTGRRRLLETNTIPWGWLMFGLIIIVLIIWGILWWKKRKS